MTQTTHATHTPGQAVISNKHPARILFGCGATVAVSDHSLQTEIVRRWNAHDELLAACEEAIDAIDNSTPDEIGANDRAREMLRSAIARAKGGAA